MSRTDSLKAVDRKPVTLDEQQDCWQTCIAMLLQNTHVKGFPLITTDGNPFKIGGIHEKADASNLAIDGRLFTEPEHDIDMEWILNETIKAFDAAVATVDEQALVLQWETTHARQLRHANLQYHEHIENNAMFQEEMNHAVQALSIPSPTQLTVDICRKQFREGTYRSDPVTSSHIKSLTEKLRAKNKKK